jgi:hypothetical protein
MWFTNDGRHSVAAGHDMHYHRSATAGALAWCGFLAPLIAWRHCGSAAAIETHPYRPEPLIDRSESARVSLEVRFMLSQTFAVDLECSKMGAARVTPTRV